MINYSKLEEPPVSEQVLDYLEKEVILKLTAGMDVSLIGFPGNGKTADIIYYINNLSIINPTLYETNIFTLLDLEMLRNNEKNACAEFLYHITRASEKILTPEAYTYIESLLSQEVGFTLLVNILEFLTTKINVRVTVFLDNFHVTYEGDDSTPLCNLIFSLRKHHPDKVSFCYLTSKEFSDESLSYLGKLKGFLLQNIVWSGTRLFDSNSVDYIVAIQERKYKKNLTQAFKEALKKYTAYDPVVTKMATIKAITDSDFENAFVQATSVEVAYKLVGELNLKHRYINIINALSYASIKELNTNIKHPTEYLVGTQLVHKNPEGNFALLNPMFEYFINSNKVYLNTFTGTHTQGFEEVQKSLTGNELLIFNLLTQKEGEIISKEEIAKTLWPINWEDNYSEWAINQTIYRIRSKLKNDKFDLKTIKNKGFILSIKKPDKRV